MGESRQSVENQNESGAPRTEDQEENSTPDGSGDLTSRISASDFEEWYQEREFARNILEGNSYFNNPSPVQSPEHHNPSKLLQCHRKLTYSQLNAPEESGDPRGIFWFGSRFETDIIVPYLRHAVTNDDEFVANSIWVDYSVESDAGTLRIKGETDPVIVDRDANPLLLTEIKTKKSVQDLDSPSKHHRAQAHAYMKGLSEKHERNITDAVIVYGSRTDLSLRAFHIEFSPWFWTETVIRWAETHTTYRLNNELPEADPEHEWECSFCSFQERCGKGDSPFEDVEPEGLLPGFVEYPKSKLIEYLEAHEGARLTPSLAHHYPELIAEHGVYDWHCQVCGTSHAWNAVDWNGDVSVLPRCPACSDSEPVGILGGPKPENQQHNGDDSDYE